MIFCGPTPALRPALWSGEGGPTGEISMTGSICNLDWNRLLGCDQADPDRLSPPPQALPAGRQALAAALHAKVGNKDQLGVLGRPQDLPLVA